MRVPLRRVVLVATLAAVLSPVTGVVLILLAAPLLFGTQAQAVSAVDQINLLAVYGVYALVFTGLPAALVAAVGALLIFSLGERGLSRSILLSVGTVLGAVGGLAVFPPPGYHIVDLVEIVRNGPRSRPYGVVGVINGAVWGLVIADYVLRSSRGPRWRRRIFEEDRR